MSGTDEVLTPEESEALLEQGAAAADSMSAGGVRTLELDYWEHVTPDRIPALETINADIAESLSAIWQRMFKRPIVASALESRWIKGRELAAVSDRYAIREE